MTNKFLEELKLFGLNKVIDYLDKDPDKNIPKVIEWAKALDRADYFVGPIQLIEEVVHDEDSNWHKYVKSLYTDIDDEVRKKLFKNFIVNATVKGCKIQKEYEAKYECNVPWAIILDPTTACNLNCDGCWAADYGRNLSMSYNKLDETIKEAKELGTYMFIFSGGEPLMRKDDIMKLAAKHDDSVFLAFTNGTLIDEKFAERMKKVKNFVPAISIEGFEEETDSRRGEGTYRSVISAMELLQERNLPFGVSCCTTSKNTETLMSEDFIDKIIELGAKFAWFFTYMPVGVNASPDLMISAGQRKYMYKQLREYRKNKPLFTIDFWNDGEYVDGCIAGGDRYIHINANGDVEPCAFIHYSDSNIYEKSLLESYQSPLFMQYYKRQPFNENLLRPCPLLDNKGKLAEMVETAGAKSTDLASPEDVHNLCAKCADAADAWAEVASKLWNKNEIADQQSDNQEEKALI
ncbi:MAG: radical SAM protein [Bacillota bacterium]